MGRCALHDHRRVPADRAQPAAELVGVVHRGREADETDLGGRHHEDLLPDPAAVGILDEVDLVEDDGVQPLEEVRARQEHVAQDLGGHHDHGGTRLHGRIPRQEPDVVLAVGGDELAVLLVGEGLERRRVEGLAPRRQGAVHGVGRHEGLARPRRCRDEHGLPAVERIEGLALEVVERERQAGLELRRPGRLLDGPPEGRQRPNSFPMPIEMK